MRHNEPKKSGTFEDVNWHESQLKIVWAFSFVLPVLRFHRRVFAGSAGASRNESIVFLADLLKPRK